MDSLLENPVFIVVIGLSTVAVVGWLWLQTGRRIFLVGVIAAVVLTVVGLLAERSFKTDREQIEETLHAIARDVERNDLEALLSHIHPRAPQIRQMAAGEMPRYKFEAVRIKPNLKIEVREDNPPTGIAEFNVVVVGSGGGLDRTRSVPRFVIVEFEKDGDLWRVVDYEHDDPTRGYKRR